MKQKIINLFAGPGAGKSTVASGLYYHLKTKGVLVELVREYIKDAAWEGRKTLFDDQVYIFAKQNRRQHILHGKVDWIVTDSPILLSAVYSDENYYESFENLCLEAHDTYDNYNFFLTRTKDYVKKGRIQDEGEARAIDNRIRSFLELNCINYSDIPGDASGVYGIIEYLNL